MRLPLPQSYLGSIALTVALLGCNASLGDGAGSDASADIPDASTVADANVDAALPPDATPADAQPCVEGDDRVTGTTTGHCYMLFSGVVTWDQARTACEALGPTTHLATSTSMGENDDFSPLAGLLDIWVGGNDIDIEGTWVWVTGEPMTAYTNWRDGEPNNSGTDGEDCMVIEGDNGGLWDDRNCVNQQYGYICERD